MFFLYLRRKGERSFARFAPAAQALPRNLAGREREEGGARAFPRLKWKLNNKTL